MARDSSSTGWSVEKYLKGFIAFNVLQLIGPIFLAYFSPSTLTTQILPSGTPSHMRTHAMLAMMHLIIKISLLCSFSSSSLHIVHLLTSLFTGLYLSIELFFYRIMPLTTANLFNLTLNVLTVIFWILCWSSLNETPEQPRRGPRKLFAKHYMEGNMFGVEDIENEKARRAKDKNL